MVVDATIDKYLVQIELSTTRKEEKNPSQMEKVASQPSKSTVRQGRGMSNVICEFGSVYAFVQLCVGVMMKP